MADLLLKPEHAHCRRISEGFGTFPLLENIVIRGLRHTRLELLATRADVSAF
jgi:hypothetical protein